MNCIQMILLFLFAVVYRAFAITLQDKTADKEEYAFRSAIFSCSFDSKLPVNITFQFKGQNVSPGDSSDFKIIPTTDYLTQFIIKNLTASLEGTYTCIGTNQEGTAKGDFNVVIRKISPTIISPFDDVYLQMNQTYSMQCGTQIDPPPYPTPTYSWRKINSLLEPAYVKDDGRGRLTILRMRKEDEGTYECEARNSKGVDTKALKIFFTNSTNFVSRPAKNVNIRHGEQAKFVVSIKSVDGTPRFSWFKDTNPTPVNSYQTSVFGSLFVSTYTIERSTVADAGEYKVTVDGLIVTMSIDFQVTVWAKPIVQIDRKEEVVKEGGKAKFICRVNAYPTPDIKWLLNGTVVSSEEIEQIFQATGQKSSLSFSIDKVTNSHGAAYKCFANNSQGEGSDTVKLIVDVPLPTKEKNNNTTIVIVVVVISIVIIALIVVLVFIYIKFRESWFGKLNGKGAFYTDLVQEEKDVSSLADIENNPCAINKNINISIRQIERNGSVGATGRAFSINKNPGSTKQNTFRNTLKSTLKSPTQGNEQQYAPLDAAMTQGKQIEFKHLMFDELLGEGESGLVYGGRLIDDEDTAVYKDVSIKMLKENFSAQEKRDMLAELRLMRRISRHPNVIAFIGWCTAEDNVYVIEEYAPFGSLLTFLRAHRSLNQSMDHLNELSLEDRVDQKTLLSFAWQIASGMKHLASQQVVHRDLACRNIYLGHEKTCKISEYGLSRDIYSENVYRKKTGGQLPVRWMSYESVFQGVYTTESDVWSFGVLIWELVTLGKIPYPGIVRTEQLLDELESGYHMENPGHISTDLYLLMNSCWNREPKSRPSFESLQRQLGDFMKDENEIHIDLEKLHQNEVDADEDFVLRSQASDNNHFPPGFKRIEEEEEEEEESDKDNTEKSGEVNEPDVIVADNAHGTNEDVTA